MKKILAFETDGVYLQNVTATLSFVDTGISLKDEKTNAQGLIYKLYQLLVEKRLSIRFRSTTSGSLFNNAAVNLNQEKGESVMMS